MFILALLRYWRIQRLRKKLIRRMESYQSDPFKIRELMMCALAVNDIDVVLDGRAARPATGRER
jgi:hypothetical protein